MRRLLIANRSEIARRIQRTAKRMGIATVAVYSDADAGALHVREADQAVRIGPPPARESYLSIEAILRAAAESGADAVHPGYGFLSENADFAQAVLDAGLIWVGPPPAAIRAMGPKDAAKALMEAAGVPVTPGYRGDDQSDARLAQEAERIGYPVLIKAVAGGGGKGMRRVDRAEDFAASLASCRREAAASFGDERVLLETYLARPRHIEVQVFADTHGHVVHLFERDCSVQRRHQKVIEEAPAPGLDEATRQAICARAVAAARAVAYEGAGTIEFIADASGPLVPERIWFMEMNTRLQVEHPVTEAITGLDLVEWQLRVARGEPLPLTQDRITRTGHAIEARLYAENPATGFLPSTGKLEDFALRRHGGSAPKIRIETGVEQGDAITGFYDPMIAKLIVQGETRAEAADRLAAALAEVEVWPVRTNAPFLVRCLRHPAFRDGGFDTGFVAAHLADLLPAAQPSRAVLEAAALEFVEEEEGDDPWEALPGFRMGGAPEILVLLDDGEARHEARIDPPPRRRRWDRIIAPSKVGMRVAMDGSAVLVFEDGQGWRFTRAARRPEGAEAASGGAVASPMPGRVIAVAVREGDRVEKGASLLTLEAMKMELTLTAPLAGTVTGLTAAVGAQVSEGVVLARIEPPDA